MRKLIKAIWAEARKDLAVINLIELRNDVRDLYSEIMHKEPS